MGPNGSGKSNVIDSMLFVFGCRAAKIRAKAFKAMIHKSSKYPNVTSCKVAVHFQQIIDKEDGGFTVVPNSQFNIARVANQNSKSYYTIDEKEVNFKAVSSLLSGFGVDLKYNRFLILQVVYFMDFFLNPKC
jgi:structural maintenance of chromosome 4